MGKSGIGSLINHKISHLPGRLGLLTKNDSLVAISYVKQRFATIFIVLISEICEINGRKYLSTLRY